MHRIEWQTLDADRHPNWFETANPPTCRRCWPLAMRLCPSLRQYGGVALTVPRVRPVAVVGEIITPEMMFPFPVNMRLDDDNLRYTVAKMLIVRMTDYQIHPDVNRLAG